jgi:hypothetical protein
MLSTAPRKRFWAVRKLRLCTLCKICIYAPLHTWWCHLATLRSYGPLEKKLPRDILLHILLLYQKSA